MLNNTYLINHNFELIFGRLNHDLIPKVESIQKFLRKQKHKNKNIILAIMGIGVYIYLNEKHQREQKKEFNKLKEEIAQLKGEQIMK